MTVLRAEPLKNAKKKRLSAYLDPDVMNALADYAARRDVSLSLIAEAAIASFLSPDAEDRKQAAIARRLDQLDRRVQRVERDVGIAIETLALFVRFWLSSTPALPESAQAEARAKGLQRYDRFVDALGRRLSKGPKLRQEIAEDVPPASPADAEGAPAR
jgi:predicted transcriptional regulator